jgi:uncharacterized protein YkwD
MKRKLVFIIIGLLVPAFGPFQVRAMDNQGATLYARTLLEQINLYRRDNGLHPLRFDANLIHLAKNHSFAMSQQKRVSHNNFKERFERSGSRLCVENVGWNYSTRLSSSMPGAIQAVMIRIC